MIEYGSQTQQKIEKGSKRFVTSDELCTDCRESDMVQLFEDWKKNLPGYFREHHRKQSIPSPWHHYKLQNVQN